MLTWSRDGPRYNKMVSEDKIKKNMSKSGIFNTQKEGYFALRPTPLDNRVKVCLEWVSNL